MIEELMTGEVDDYVKNNSGGRVFVRISIANDNDFDFTKARGILRMLGEEKKNDDIDIIVYSSNAVVQSRVLGNENMSKPQAAESIINHLHLDYIPYTELIISLPKTEDNERLMREVCMKFGVFV